MLQNMNEALEIIIVEAYASTQWHFQIYRRNTANDMQVIRICDNSLLLRKYILPIDNLIDSFSDLKVATSLLQTLLVS